MESLHAQLYHFSNCQVDLVHAGGTLRDHYSLMDVAYIYSWKRVSSCPLNMLAIKSKAESSLKRNIVLKIKGTCFNA